MIPKEIKNPLTAVADLAFKQYESGEISHERLLYVLEHCVNAAAKCNGYEDRFGLPFDPTDSVTDTNTSIEGADKDD